MQINFKKPKKFSKEAEMNFLLKGTGVGLGTFVVARWAGAFGEREIVISKEDQSNRNSFGRNWFSVKRGWFWDEVIEYEDWFAGQEMPVCSHGWSYGRLKIKYEK